jgi:hypothetical protein
MKTRRQIVLIIAVVQAALGGTASGGQQVISWGVNFSGETTTNTPPGLSNVVAVDTVPIINLALLTNGTITGWGDDSQGQLDAIGLLTNVVAMAGGFSHVLALTRDGTVQVAAWGNNQQFFTNVPANLSNVVALAAGGSHSLALLGDATVVAWGQTPSATPFVVPPGLANVLDVQATLVGGLALKADGTVTALGDGFSTPPPPGLSNIVAISTAIDDEDFMALRSDGSVVTWTAGGALAGFRDSLPAPSDPTPLLAINMEHFHSLGIAQDGTLRAWRLRTGVVSPPEPYLQIPAEAASGVIAFAAGREANVAVVGEFGWPQIIAQPQTVVTTDGESVTFQVGATSVLPLNYQWYFNGVNLVGETHSTLRVSGVDATKAGPYGVVVTTDVRRVRSQPAWLGVVPVMQVERAGSQVKLSWPMSGADYWLEETAGMTQPFRTAFENIVTNQVTGRIEAALNPSGQARFFRLWLP